jgi:6-pyruvoyl-tetrahydropterin synthase
MNYVRSYVVVPFCGRLHDSNFKVACQLQGEENLGMAMTFTLVSHLREQLSSLVRIRAENIAKAEVEKERLALEVLKSELPTCSPI